MKEVDVQEIVKKNPQVDTEALRRGQELSRRLKERRIVESRTRRASGR